MESEEESSETDGLDGRLAAAVVVVEVVDTARAAAVVVVVVIVVVLSGVAGVVGVEPEDEVNDAEEKKDDVVNDAVREKKVFLALSITLPADAGGGSLIGEGLDSGERREGLDRPVWDEVGEAAD